MLVIDIFIEVSKEAENINEYGQLDKIDAINRKSPARSLIFSSFVTSSSDTQATANVSCTVRFSEVTSGS